MFMVLPSSGYWCNNSLMHCSIYIITVNFCNFFSRVGFTRGGERERRITPDTERKLQGMTVNLEVDYYVHYSQHSFQLSHFI